MAERRSPPLALTGLIWLGIGLALVVAIVWFHATPLVSGDETGPLWVRLLWEMPTLVAVMISVLGLPRRSPVPADPAAPAIAATA